MSGQTKFKTRWNAIERVEVERETEHNVWVNGRQFVKRTGWDNYFDSFAEAKQYLVAQAEKEVSRLKEQLHKARTALGNAQSLKES